MREIKFRVFSEKDKMMFYDWSSTIYFAIMRMLVDWWMILEKDWFKIMQFTWLLDKNGKEIYEGDFVKTYDDEWNIENNGYASLVLFKNCCFHLYDDYEILRDKSAWWWSVEVIWNRFENPDLIP